MYVTFTPSFYFYMVHMHNVDLICWYLMLVLFALFTFVVTCAADIVIKRVCFKE